MMFTRGRQRLSKTQCVATYIFILMVVSTDLRPPLAASGDFEDGVGWSTTDLQ